MIQTFSKKIVTYPDMRLKTPTIDIPKGTDLTMLVGELYETMYSSGGIGISANQIGQTEKVFVVDIEGIRRVFVNPRDLTHEGQADWEVREGCLSFPGFFATVKRFATVEVTYEDAAYNTKTETFSGLWAACVQHEYDHLMGVTMLEHLSPMYDQIARRKIKNTMRKIKKVQS